MEPKIIGALEPEINYIPEIELFNKIFIWYMELTQSHELNCLTNFFVG